MLDDKPFDPVATGRSIMRGAIAGSLGTLDANGNPFVTLATVATMPDGRPVFALSDLAVHTKNLKNDSRASLLLVAPGGETGNPLAGARITLTGTIERTEDPIALWRYDTLHGGPGGHSSFKDFNHYLMTITGSHLVAGFGRIAQIAPEDLLVDISDSADLLENEKMVVEHMNDDHLDAISLYAEKLLGLPASDWKMTGCDPDGVDLISKAGRARLSFPTRATSVAAAGGHLKTFARDARSAGV
ncbi:pyridoxamine 5'-phosphate oxidase family protein [Kaistia dalseonensis]|uniref:Heme iron utilization protein n=1 Tax=Kaistia dalseonensis TaxID=410840 RepID=A0ABU0H651_9HYPH|nr:DUF2470 domain-containing protein [Kaistia dalseonensis]MCX5494921.1 pyridoxamine 5'-phosphate oxidase family protein [Kaistia dalseonensis]MDQ0437502.1 putative heme iron utilization protein [Kaistia dalseonensis]